MAFIFCLAPLGQTLSLTKLCSATLTVPPSDAPRRAGWRTDLWAFHHVTALVAAGFISGCHFWFSVLSAALHSCTIGNADPYSAWDDEPARSGGFVCWLDGLGCWDLRRRTACTPSLYLN